MANSVRVSMKYVRNLGNFESLHLDVGVESDVKPGETTDAAFNRVYGFVEAKLVEKMEEAEKELGLSKEVKEVTTGKK